VNNKPLCLAIIDALMMLEHSRDDQLDPDLAVKTMESMSASLRKLGRDDQLELRRIFTEIADGSGNVDKTFIEAVPEMMGLATSEE
jgi:hypothetical protein